MPPSLSTPAGWTVSGWEPLKALGQPGGQVWGSHGRPAFGEESYTLYVLYRKKPKLCLFCFF